MNTISINLISKPVQSVLLVCTGLRRYDADKVAQAIFASVGRLDENSKRRVSESLTVRLTAKAVTIRHGLGARVFTGSSTDIALRFLGWTVAVNELATFHGTGSEFGLPDVYRAWLDGFALAKSGKAGGQAPSTPTPTPTP